MTSIENLLGERLFQVGAIAGAIAVLLIGLIATVRGPSRHGLPRLAGVALASSVVALAGSKYASPSLIAGLVALAAAGAVIDRTRAHPWIRPLLGLPGGALLALHDFGGPSWSEAAVVMTTALAGGLASTIDERREGVVGTMSILSLLTAGGLWLTLPDTEPALAVLGCATPLALLAWPEPLARFGAIGTLPAIGLLTSTAAMGGASRPSAIVGGIACLGMIVVAPLSGIGLHGRIDIFSAVHRLLPGRELLALAVGQLGLVLIASRVLGMSSTAAGAVIGAAALLATALAACRALIGTLPPDRLRSDLRRTRRTN